MSNNADTSKKIEMGSLVRAFEALQDIINSPVDGEDAIKIIKLIRWARPHYLRYLASHAAEVEEYGEKNDDGPTTIPVERQAEFDTAMGLANSELIEFSPNLALDPKCINSVKISAVVVERLEPFLTRLY